MSGAPQEYADEPGGARKLPLLYNLVYCSRAATDVDDDAVAAIIATARRNNPRKGITGMLVFGGGIFFQWLEGPHKNIAELMERLRRDPRHDSIVLLSEDEERRERIFPKWDMEQVAPADVRDVLLDALSTVENETSAAALRAHLAHLDSGELIGPAPADS